MKARIKSSYGFALTELIILLAFIGILSGIALPKFTSNWDDERLNTATKATMAWLNDLRQRAIQNSVPCRATWDINESRINGQCDNDSAVSSSLNLKVEVPESDSLAINLESDEPTTWVFTPRGTSTTNALATFTLSNSSDPGRCLRISAPLGLLRAAKKTSEGLCDYTTAY